MPDILVASKKPSKEDVAAVGNVVAAHRKLALAAEPDIIVVRMTLP